MEDRIKPWSLRRMKEAVSAHHIAADRARKLSNQCRDLYHSDPWTKEEREEFKSRGMAPSDYNFVQRGVNFLMGLEQSRRTDPKAYPQSENHEDAAEIATDILRTEVERLNFDRRKSLGFRDLLIEDAVAAFVGVEPSANGAQYDNSFERIAPEDFVYDPLSRENNFSDAGWLGIARFFDLDYALEHFAGDDSEKRKVILASQNTGGAELASIRDHEQERMRWFDSEQERVFIVQLYYRLGGEWVEATFTSQGELSHQWSPYLDQYGKTRCPIIARSLYVDREGVRHGRVKSMIGPQLEINKRMSRMLWLLSTKQMRVGPAVDVEQARSEASKPDGIFVGDQNDIELISHTQDIAHHAQLLQQNIGFMELQGPNRALQGRGVENQSGRAIQAQQQSGLMEENEPFDMLRDWALECYRALWMNCQQFWTEERTILVTERDDAYQFLHVNQPMTDEMGYPLINPMTGQVALQNPITEMHVDIRVDAGPDTVTLKAEQREQLLQLLQIYGAEAIPPQVAFEFFELTSETRKKIQDAMTGGDDPEAQRMRQLQQQVQEMMQQLQLQAAQLDNADKQAEIEETRAKAQKLYTEIQGMQAKLTGQHPDQIMDAIKTRADLERVAAA